MGFVFPTRGQHIFSPRAGSIERFATSESKSQPTATPPTKPDFKTSQSPAKQIPSLSVYPNLDDKCLLAALLEGLKIYMVSSSEKTGTIPTFAQEQHIMLAILSMRFGFWVTVLLPEPLAVVAPPLAPLVVPWCTG